MPLSQGSCVCVCVWEVVMVVLGGWVGESLEHVIRRRQAGRQTWSGTDTAFPGCQALELFPPPHARTHAHPSVLLSLHLFFPHFCYFSPVSLSVSPSYHRSISLLPHTHTHTHTSAHSLSTSLLQTRFPVLLLVYSFLIISFLSLAPSLISPLSWSLVMKP